MFGYVTANMKELTKEQQARYGAVYCGICRGIRRSCSQSARLALSYDMAFLALLLMSLYEPEEITGDRACMLHPLRKRGWVDNEYIRYAADMNVVLGYYKAIDDTADEGHIAAKAAASVLKKGLVDIEARYPRQCAAISHCIARLNELEKTNCPNPDEGAACFGALMGQLLTYREDLWATALSQMGMALGRFIYLADAAIDYRKDRKHHRYNPFLAMGMEEDWQRWEEYLVLAMGRCTEHFEKLPLVQDKPLLDNILYSGVWVEFKRHCKCSQEDRND